MNNSNLISLIGFIKPKIKEDFLHSLIKLEINKVLSNYYNFTNTYTNALNKCDNRTFVTIMLIKMFGSSKTLVLLNKKVANLPKRECKFLTHDSFEVTLKNFKKLLFKLFFKKTEFLILFFKQTIKNTSQNKVSFLIKTINQKILNTFKFLGDFFCILIFFQKIMGFMCKQKGFFIKRIQQFTLKLKKEVYLYHQVLLAKLYFMFNTLLYPLRFALKGFTPFGGTSVAPLVRCLQLQQQLRCCSPWVRFFAPKGQQTVALWAKTEGKALAPSGALQNKGATYSFALCSPLIWVPRGEAVLWKGKKDVTNKINAIKLRSAIVVYLKSVFNTASQPVKSSFTQNPFFLIRSTFFTKIKILLIKQASFIAYFLNKVLWKWTKKEHTQVSYACLVNKYWIFIEKWARFYFFEKAI